VFRVHTECAQFLSNLPGFLGLGLGSPLSDLSSLRFSFSSPLGKSPGLSLGFSAIPIGFTLSEPQGAVLIIETQIRSIRNEQAVEMLTP
jgi:hypothetical protein